MTHCTRELTKEQFDEIMAESKGAGRVPNWLESKHFSESTLLGYGLYGTHVYEKDNKYYLDYSIGDSCD